MVNLNISFGNPKQEPLENPFYFTFSQLNNLDLRIWQGNTL